MITYLLMVIFLSLPAEAGLRLFEWTADTTLAPLILPVRESETPEQAAERYLKNLERSADLMELFAGHRPSLPNSEFKELSDKDLGNRALLIANLPKDYTLDSLRVSNFMALLNKNNHRSLILPIAADVGLSRSESMELSTLISDKFPLLVAMGGEDVDPALYKKENLHSRNIIPARDRFEMQVIKDYVTAEKGFLLGVCRGAQISSVALGYELNQHVPFHVGKEISHADGWHDVKVHQTKNNILYSLTQGTGTLHVNSLHHQAVRFKSTEGPLDIAAQANDGVTEALELKNGRGLLLQFHPELMNNLLGQQIINQVIVQKSRANIPSCGRVFH